MTRVERPAQASFLGGKAATLRELRDAGFPVPEFELAPEQESGLDELARRLGFPLVVRSSASVEDSTDHSFAGMFESFLNISNTDQLIEAVRKCRASIHSARVVNYCERNCIPAEALQMHVVVQKMIRAELAGAAFTVNPLTGEETIIIEAVSGLADDLMAGRVCPIAAGDQLVERYRPQISELAHNVQLHFGRPQDIEFAVENGTVYLVQARPITRIQFSLGTGEWTNADFRDGGVSSTVCSPLMWSLYEFIWDQSLKGCLRELYLYREDFVSAKMFFGRPYWNLGAVKKAVARLPGFVEREFHLDLSIQPTYEGDGWRTPLTLTTAMNALPCLAALPFFFRRQMRLAESVLKMSPSIVQSFSENTENESRFRELIEQHFALVETTYFKTVYAISLAKLDFKQSVPQCEYAPLMGGLPEIRHMAPMRHLAEYQQQHRREMGEHDLSDFIARYRHHSRFGIDIIYPRWDEDRDFVRDLCRQEQTATRLDERQENSREAFARASVDALRQMPFWKRGTFRRKLDRLRKFVWLREELRDVSLQMYYLIRRYVLTIAARRELGSDVFFQTFREVYSDDRQKTAERRNTYSAFRNFDAPNEIGSRYQFDPQMQTGDLCGICASTGVAVGPAYVARTVEEAMRAESGMILVCPFTEPGWTPVLGRVSGVVTEVGGLLSHAAVLCREYGIPAVLGVAQATRRIRSGDKIELDAHRGTVRILGKKNQTP